MSRLIIFDFDGVLADSVQVVFKMNQEAVASLNKSLTMEEYCACFEGHINQRLAEMYTLDDVQKKELVDLKAVLFPKYYNSDTIQLFSFARDLVVEASKLGELWIVSSSPTELITGILESYGLVKYFTKIIGQNRQPKGEFFKSTLDGRKKGEVFFITDTTGDIKEIRKTDVEISVLAVAWGFHTVSLLESEKPSVVVHDSKEIIDFISEHQVV